MSAGSRVHTVREALLAEALGDLSELLDRAEDLKATLPGLADDVAARIDARADALIVNLSEGLAKTGGSQVDQIRTAGNQITVAVRQMENLSSRMMEQGTAKVVALAIGGGFLGGLSAGALLYITLAH